MNDVTPKTRLNKKSVTFLGSVAFGVAVLGLVINDKLSGRRKNDES